MTQVDDAEGDRPQDVGRPHRRKGQPSAATLGLLARYHASMRGDLAAILDELEPVTPPAGLGLVEVGPQRKPVADRVRLWDLAIKLGRELGTEMDPGPLPDAGTPAKPRTRARRVDYGGS